MDECSVGVSIADEDAWCTAMVGSPSPSVKMSLPSESWSAYTSMSSMSASSCMRPVLLSDVSTLSKLKSWHITPPFTYFSADHLPGRPKRTMPVHEHMWPSSAASRQSSASHLPHRFSVTPSCLHFRDFSQHQPSGPFFLIDGVFGGPTPFLPASPAGPGGPEAPESPLCPGSPGGPAFPGGPGLPGRPGGPMAPGSPGGPSPESMPGGPGTPGLPLAPLTPAAPGRPRGPFGPGKP
mmetsp:Transcript_11078/g.26121  ORF Transcript_11078/g.26121 Transcript_11078/m.26121 type:complete len:237 (-) Transcript_11078:774-1484(-)